MHDCPSAVGINSVWPPLRQLARSAQVRRVWQEALL